MWLHPGYQFPETPCTSTKHHLYGSRVQKELQRLLIQGEYLNIFLLGLGVWGKGVQGKGEGERFPLCGKRFPFCRRGRFPVM